MSWDGGGRRGNQALAPFAGHGEAQGEGSSSALGLYGVMCREALTGTRSIRSTPVVLDPLGATAMAPLV